MDYRSKQLAGWARFSYFFVPNDIAEALQKELETRDEDAAETESAEHEEDVTSPGVTVSPDPSAPAQTPPDIRDGVTHLVIEQDQTEEFARRSVRRFTDRDERERAKHLVEDLKRDRGYRKLARLAPDWPAELYALERDFPNFAEARVFDYLRAMFTLASLDNGVPDLAPMLWCGPPGIGKTFLSDRLAEILGVPLHRVCMEVEQTNSTLCGSSEFWSNTKPGMLFNMLTEGMYANALVLLDEVDKAGGDSRYDPLGPLYGLLERRTAGHFHDLAFPGLELDASRVNWVCTANTDDSIPEPLLSRMRRFDIPAPTAAQCAALARKIFEGARTKLPVEFHALSDEACQAAVKLTPREMEPAMREAIGKALSAGRDYVIPADFHLPPSKPGLGFVW